MGTECAESPAVPVDNVEDMVPTEPNPPLQPSAVDALEHPYASPIGALGGEDAPTDFWEMLKVYRPVCIDAIAI